MLACSIKPPPPKPWSKYHKRRPLQSTEGTLSLKAVALVEESLVLFAEVQVIGSRKYSTGCSSNSSQAAYTWVDDGDVHRSG